MNSYKDRIEYLAQAYIAIAKRYHNWDLVKELIERNKETEADVKKRIKELYARNRPE
jgi:ferritin